ncbi:MAG: Ig-like domain repeat protein [Methanobrevibacter sp.]|nr:Ig-like domain repeat protein [Methanobrevibacter sp.]
MSLLDRIKKYLTRKGVKLIAEDFTKTIGDSTPLSIALYDDNNSPIAGKEVEIEIHSETYYRKTDEDGIARLNINLPVGGYDTHVVFDDPEYHYTRTFLKVTVCPIIKTSDLTMTVGDGSKFTAVAESANGYAVSGVKITFNVNGINYERTTDNKGIASLPINLQQGDYKIITKCHNIALENTIHIDKAPKKATKMEGTDLNMTYKDGSKYQCAVYDDAGRVSGTVRITINGVPYDKTPDSQGLYKLNINLNPGTYQVKAEYLGDDTHLPSSVTNTIKVNEAPKPTPTPTPTKLYPYLTSQGAGKLGQRTGYTCGPHSLMQAIYRLTGIELSEMELAGICGTTTSGTGHSGLETGLAWFNRKYGYNLKMTWKNFSEVGFQGLQKYYENGAVFCHLLYRNQWGHYEVPLTSNSNPMKILNSLGDSCGGGYCGYIESRSQSTQQSYINGISQKSICIITRG